MELREMTYDISITSSALKEYQSVSEPYKSKIKEKIDSLASIGLQSSNIIALKGLLKGLFRMKVGDYRVVFKIESNKITIVSILHRKDVYRK